MVDEVRIDHILQVSSPVIRQKYVYGFRAGVGLVGSDAVVDAMDDVRVRREEGIGFYFFEGLRDGFLAKGTADFLEGEELLVGGVLDEIDIAEASLIDYS